LGIGPDTRTRWLELTPHLLSNVSATDVLPVEPAQPLNTVIIATGNSAAKGVLAC
jgi:hypothetical protein